MRLDNSTPAHFEHDCEDCCIYVGHLKNVPYKTDVYLHTGDDPQFIVRDGNNGWEYSSDKFGFKYHGVKIPTLLDNF